MNTCKDCGRPLLWASTAADGRVPLDPDPRPDGSVVLDQYGSTGPLHADGVPDLTRRFVPHRLTCGAKE